MMQGSLSSTAKKVKVMMARLISLPSMPHPLHHNPIEEDGCIASSLYTCIAMCFHSCAVSVDFVHGND